MEMDTVDPTARLHQLAMMDCGDVIILISG